jgi:hypothetical protein
MNALIEACRNPVSPLEKLISLSKGPRYISFWSDFVAECEELKSFVQ